MGRKAGSKNKNNNNADVGMMSLGNTQELEDIPEPQNNVNNEEPVATNNASLEWDDDWEEDPPDEDEEPEEPEELDHQQRIPDRAVALTVTHAKLLSSAKKRKQQQDEDPDYNKDDNLDNVQTQSLKVRLTKLNAKKSSIETEFAENKEKLLTILEQLADPLDANEELRKSLKISRTFFKHILTSFVLNENNHISMINGVSVVKRLTSAMETTVSLLEAPEQISDVTSGIHSVKEALLKKAEEEFNIKQMKARERFLSRQRKLLASSQDMDDYDDHRTFD